MIDAMTSPVRALACAATALLLASCAGSGGNPLLPSGGLANPAVARSSAATLEIWLRIPPRPAIARPRYVSPSTKSLTVREGSKLLGTFATSAKAKGCAAKPGALICTFKMSAIAGKNKLFTISTYDAADGKGKVLAAGRVAQTIVAGSNEMLLALSGVVKSLSIALVTPSGAPAGTPASLPVVVMAKDADGNLIVGQENYGTPIALSDSDASGITTLSRNGGTAATSITVNSPADQVALQYDGKSLESATLTATASGATAATPVAFIPTPTQVASYFVTPPSGYVTEADDIAAGNDGNLWLALQANNSTTSQYGIAKMTTAGTSTLYLPGTAPSTNLPNTYIDAIVAASAGSAQAAWFTTASQVGTITESGAVTMYSPPGSVCGGSVGDFEHMIGDGSTGIWVTAECNSGGDALVHVDASGAMVPSAQVAGFAQSWGLVFGKGGKIYVAGKDTASGHGAVAQFTVSGSTVTGIAVAVSQDGEFYDIAAEQDGSLYVDDGFTTLARLQPSATFSATTFGNTVALPLGFEPYGMVVLPDGTLWVESEADPAIARVVPSSSGGSATTFELSLNPQLTPDLYGLAAGPDGNLYVMDFQDNLTNNVSGEVVKVAY